jgi:hypothetical protein
MRIRVSFLLVLLSLFSQGLSAAEGDPEEGPDDARARDAFDEGKNLYNADRFIEAAEKFREAYRLRPTWKLYFNIAQSEAAAKRHGLALEAFERYLSQGGDEVQDDRHGLVLTEIKRLRPIVGFVKIAARFPGATVRIDGIARAEMPLVSPLMVAAGVEHQVTLEQGGNVMHVWRVRVAGEQTLNLYLEEASVPEEETRTAAPPAEQSEPEVEKPPPPPPDRGSGKQTIGIVGLGLGAALIVSGAITGGIALGDYSELKERCPDNHCPSDDDRQIGQRADALALATDVLIPTGVVLGAVGAILLVLSRKDRQGEAADTAAAKPVIQMDGSGISVKGRF